MKHWSQDLYLKAWNYACRAHNGQNMPGSELPYINHVGAVAMEILGTISRDETIEDPDLALQCALLHDVIEDTSIDVEEIKWQFGEAVAQGVLALSKNPDLPDKEQQMQDSLIRIKSQPREVWMVKLADRITNLQAPPRYWPIRKVAQYHAQAALILETLGSASKPLSDRLHTRLKEYRRFF
ncbi:MAG: bifunctional (p)ppGpp synthetase/guanosine-3',5'-bis(diphosphate) 3'-pyrophosphohydrolase [Gammaproteobacteria bacterium]|nr:bifunctional (p)ppGpp synthetase/guanosine-3',5'-bis(diphosphate) 3'-pyrophosphohydrolase [Gammaproteobacteria bacterium]